MVFIQQIIKRHLYVCLFFYSSYTQKNKSHSKKDLQVWLPRQFWLPVFTLFDKKKFLTKNSYQDSHHSQRGMKFATQISPLLNSFVLYLKLILGQFTVLRFTKLYQIFIFLQILKSYLVTLLNFTPKVQHSLHKYKWIKIKVTVKLFWNVGNDRIKSQVISLGKGKCH